MFETLFPVLRCIGLFGRRREGIRDEATLLEATSTVQDSPKRLLQVHPIQKILTNQAPFASSTETN